MVIAGIGKRGRNLLSAESNESRALGRFGPHRDQRLHRLLDRGLSHARKEMQSGEMKLKVLPQDCAISQSNFIRVTSASDVRRTFRRGGGKRKPIGDVPSAAA